MNPRERILAALNHELPDRTPTEGWFHAVVIERLLKHYHTTEWQEVLLQLGIEGWSSLSPEIIFPDFKNKATSRPGGLKGPKVIWLDESTYLDNWGVTHQIGEKGWYEKWVAGPLQDAQSVDDILSYPFPEKRQIKEPDNYAEQVKQLKEKNLFVTGGIPNPYKQAWLLRGMDNVLADYIINEDMVQAMYDCLFKLYKEVALCMARAGIDMIRIVGDIAMQDRIIMGPDKWRKVDKPRIADLICACRKINPEIFFFIHSDGNVSDLMDDFIEIGFNVVNPIQPECMDPFEVKKRWGDKITLHGGLSLQRALPFGTPAEVRNEVEELIQGCGFNGGLIVFPSNVLQPDTSVENIVACFHAARDYKLG